MRCFVAFGALIGALIAETAAGQPKDLGWLSSQYEVGKGGPGTISPGKFKDKETGEEKEDPGGKSYGSYQLASKRGIDGSSVSAFVDTYYFLEFRNMGAPVNGVIRGVEPGSPEFDRRWKEAVQKDGNLFRNNEHEFIYETHYEPVVQEVKKQTGVDVEARGDALKNVVWSTAVQHGPSSDPKGHAAKLIARAVEQWDSKTLALKPGTKKSAAVADKELINAIYDERERQKDDGTSVYFGDLDLSKRFKRERDDALAAQAREPPPGDAPDLNKTALGQIARNIGIIAGPGRRPPKELFVERGQMTFDFSGYDRDFETSRKPDVPNNRGGVRIGRGYDLARVPKEQAEKDLRSAGFSAGQVKVLGGAAGLVGDAARAYLNGFNYSRMSQRAKEAGLKGADAGRYVSENSPATVSLGQQQKLFEISYARAETQARELYAEFDQFPATAREAVVDMIYDLGSEGLQTQRPGFASAVLRKEWDIAAVTSKRNGIGVSRNRKIRQLLESAADQSK